MDQLVSITNLFRLSSGPLCRRRSPASESIAAVLQRRRRRTRGFELHSGFFYRGRSRQAHRSLSECLEV
ncbi:hypothetical protein BRADI_4g00880v3 [Brachypodium distachyon]|uniref:Uncharacterized protein n=1 Tax=Brachypodium distachyon TaxID=15368 RepID=A0A0Q3EH67_BRADI|nr:hypothetical protein BRADI_4g00880v3 [Brachypodium distachyon]